MDKPAGPGTVSRLHAVAFALFLFLLVNLLPGGFVKVAVTLRHFYASMHMFEYAFDHSWRFGTDIVDNVGPLGFLHYPYVYTGGAYWSKMLWYALICVVCSGFATALLLQIKGWPQRAMFYLTVLYFPLQCELPWYAYESIPRLAILFSALFLLSDRAEAKRWPGAVLLVFIGFFYASQTVEKAGNVYYLVLVIAVLCANWLRIGHWQRAAWLVGSYVAATLLIWLAAGQSLSGLPAYFSAMSLFIAAYQESLVLPTKSNYLHFGLFFLAATAILIVARVALAARAAGRFPYAESSRGILIAGLVFLTWKHGMLRGTPSYGTFLFVVPVVLAVLCFLPGGLVASRRSDLAGRAAPALVFVGLMAAVWVNVRQYDPDLKIDGGFVHEFKARTVAWRQFAPLQEHVRLDEDVARLKLANRIPLELASEIGNASIDEFGNTPELILINGLNYRPRPIPIDFIVSTDALNERNGAFYGNRESAPDYVLLDRNDWQLADTRAYLQLLVNYQPLRFWQDSLVMKKRTDGWRAIPGAGTEQSHGHLGTMIPLDEFGASFVWARLELTPTLLGALRKFLYRTENLRLTFFLENGESPSYPISVAALASGLLVNPATGDRQQLLARAGSSTARQRPLVRSIRVDLYSPADAALFRPEFNVTLTRLAAGP